VGAASARRTVVTDTPTASATACNVAPPLRRARMSAAMSWLNSEGPLGPRLCQAGPAAAQGVQLPAPTPQRDSGNPERSSHIQPRCGFDPHELDRGEPAAGFVPAVPREAPLAPDEHPSTVVVLNQRGHGSERNPAAGTKGKGRLDSHDAHHLHPPFSVEFFTRVIAVKGRKPNRSNGIHAGQPPADDRKAIAISEAL